MYRASVGCGSRALTIAVAKRNPKAQMVGIDRWGKEYAFFNKNLCEANAKAENVVNVSFSQGDALHDIMSKSRYGDMEAFAEELRQAGYEKVELIDTTNGMFMSKKEAMLMELSGSTLLVGKK